MWRVASDKKIGALHICTAGGRRASKTESVRKKLLAQSLSNNRMHTSNVEGQLDADIS